MPSEYVITGLPEATPPTRPVVTPTVALDASLLLQVPPATALLNCVVDPTHTVLPVPLIADGNGLTVTSTLVLQPPANV